MLEYILYRALRLVDFNFVSFNRCFGWGACFERAKVRVRRAYTRLNSRLITPGAFAACVIYICISALVFAPRADGQHISRYAGPRSECILMRIILGLKFRNLHIIESVKIGLLRPRAESHAQK